MFLCRQLADNPILIEQFPVILAPNVLKTFQTQISRGASVTLGGEATVLTSQLRPTEMVIH
jgi:hypothetical protein